jgi:hypothetical protein
MLYLPQRLQTLTWHPVERTIHIVMIPNADQAFIDIRKLRDYTLNPLTRVI